MKQTYEREDFGAWGGCRWQIWPREYPAPQQVQERPEYERVFMRMVAQVDAAFWYTLKRLNEDGWETFQAHGTDGCGYDLRKRLAAPGAAAADPGGPQADG